MEKIITWVPPLLLHIFERNARPRPEKLCWFSWSIYHLFSCLFITSYRPDLLLNQYTLWYSAIIIKSVSQIHLILEASFQKQGGWWNWQSQYHSLPPLHSPSPLHNSAMFHMVFPWKPLQITSSAVSNYFCHMLYIVFPWDPLSRSPVPLN